MRVLATNVVHRFGKVLDDAGELALTARHETPSTAQSVPAVGEPTLRGAPSPSADHVLGLRTVDRLERLVEPAQRLDRRRHLGVMSRVPLDVLDQACGVSHLGPPLAGHVSSDMDEVAE